jgi:hypothetical protein
MNMIILSHPMTSQEIRVLQEFRRLATQTLSIAAIKAVKHPAGGGEAPARDLVAKGYLTADETAENFTLTQKAIDFLALDPKPDVETSADSDAAVEA